MGLLRSTEDSRPLVNNTTSSSSVKSSGSTQTISDGYVNEIMCSSSIDTERIIQSKFGDSCRQSLMSIQHGNANITNNAFKGQTMNAHHLTTNFNYNSNFNFNNDNTCEFDFKKNFLRETSSGKCSFIN